MNPPISPIWALATHELVLAWLRSLPLWQSVPLIIVAGVVLAKLFDLVAVGLIRRTVRGSESVYDDILYEELHIPLVLTIGLGAVFFAGEIVPSDVATAIEPYVGRPTLSLLVLLWMRTVNRIGNRMLDEAKDSGGQYAAFAPVFSNLLTFAILVGGLFALLAIWHVNITPLLASAGIAGIAVGFAAKDTVANFFGGLALYFDRTYQLGDYIVLDSGEAGTVVKVGIRSTTVLTRDDVMVTVPNSVLNSATIVNESAPKRRKRIRVDVGVAYGTDVDELEAILEDVCAEEELILESPKPRIRFLSLGESALEYQIRAWVQTPIRETKARHRLNRAIYRRLADAGIEIPFPQRAVTLREPVGPLDGVAADVAEDGQAEAVDD